MMVNLLVVEDDTDEIKDWQKIVSRHNQKAEVEQSIPFHLEIARNIDEARLKIKTYNFSVAIIDVRLKREEDTEDYNNTDGIDVLNEIMKTTSCFSVIYTGQPKDAEDNINNDHKNYIRIIDRTTSKSALLNTLIEDEKDIIISIHEMKNKFSKSMSSLFYKSIWPRWNYWKESESKSDALHRHMATHLHAHFLNEGDQKVHPEEYFFIPPLSEKINTGDIIFDGNNFEIFVTPRCDMTRAKTSTPTYQLVKLKDMSVEWKTLEKKLKEAKEGTKSSKVTSAENELKKFTNHNGIPSQHFIQKIKILKNGEAKEYGPFFAEFDQLRSAPRTSQAQERLRQSRIATLSNEFVPSFVERLGAYFSRIGTPDYSHPD
ncbi:hypothetical protein M2G92_03590 [Vibrio vulnificus]|uniref:hypothetical protein n=1 Tax=Vibrio vulnificus TaxID=672 RepID=UPI001A20C5A7|nr:hypothetical protein [Vibrio vulnificus]MCA4023338.1 hypothetical protein [Vibrio vulnificus]MCU8314301.1 hypothetical protein [Vibrio vulnificus]HAS8399903.1 hypothetical protein [Vibrio vulnificus]